MKNTKGVPETKATELVKLNNARPAAGLRSELDALYSGTKSHGLAH